MSKSIKFKDGRVWMQRSKFLPFELLLPYGLTNINDPAGNLVVFREPSPSVRGESVIVDVARQEPGLPTFDLDTRLQRTQNFLLGWKSCNHNVQCHLGRCDRPDNYYASNMIIDWVRVYRGDGKIDRTAIIEGDNNPAAVSAPMTAEVGPNWYDMDTKFLSQRTVGSVEGFVAGMFLAGECLSDCQNQADAGQNGYAAATALVGSAGNRAGIWYTEDSGESWTQCPGNPFIASMNPSDILVIGREKEHRVIVANGTTQAGAPAQVAYADVNLMGQTTWVDVSLPTANGRYVTDLMYLDWMHIYATTDDGYIYRSSDGGATWVEAFGAGTVDFNKMAGLEGGTIWAVGNSDLIVLSQDYGDNWTVVTGPVGISADAKAVAVTPDGTVFVGYSDGSIYGSFDLGDTWVALHLQGITPTNVVDIQAWQDQVVWVVADIAGTTSRVLRSVDGGASFRLWKLATPTNAGLNALTVIDPNFVFVFGDPESGSGFISKTSSLLIGL